MFGLVSLVSMATWKTIGLVCTVSGAALGLGQTVVGMLSKSDDE